MKIPHYQNLWNSNKAMLRGKITVGDAYINTKVSNPQLEQNKPRTSRKKKIIKSRN